MFDGYVIYTNGGKYEGEFEHDLQNCYGIHYFNNGGRYEGEFKNDKSEGYGIKYFPNGCRYEGEFKNDKPEGYGIYYFNNGKRYEGKFKEGVNIGHGVFYSTALGLQYRGYFIECLSIKILFIIYQILLILNNLYSLIMRNKITLLYIIILMLGILIN